MLIYIIEGTIPLLTILLVWAGALALKGNIVKHKKIAAIHAIATWLAYIVVIVLVRLGFGIEGKAPAWILKTHLAIIYIIPVTLAVLMFTGLSGRRRFHRGLAFFHCIIWTAALFTGLLIFLLASGLL